jgi:hypothetical protein
LCVRQDPQDIDTVNLQCSRLSLGETGTNADEEPNHIPARLCACHAWSRLACLLPKEIRLSKAFGSTPDIWIKMQAAYDLAQALKREKQIRVERYAPQSAA